MMNVVTLDQPLTRFEFKHLLVNTALEFDERHLYVRREQAGVTLGTETSLLHRLSPKIVRGFSNDPAGAKGIRRSFLYLAAALAIFFSDYNAHIPLFAPLLSVAGLFNFAINVRIAWPYHWLIVKDEFGRNVVKLPATKDSKFSNPRQAAFVASLKKAIEDAKQKEYGLGPKA
jgi:hypothetical protein